MTTVITRRRRGLLLASSYVIALFARDFARAADQVASPSSQLEEITVTAEKRPEKLQNVPVSAQVVMGDVLSQQNLVSLQDLAQTDPSVRIASAARSNDLNIRGTGSGENQSFDQSVGTFIDDIYYGRSRSSTGELLDLDRIEILKGPQSTFFGNNAIAGGLNIVTKKPGDTFDASARALYGNYGQYATELGVSGPINDVFGARVAYIASGQSGWIHNVNLDTHQIDEQDWAGRITLTFKPNENFDATVKIEDGENNDRGTALQMADCPPPPPFTSTGFCQVALSANLPTGATNNLNALSSGSGSWFDTTTYALTANYRISNQVFTSVTGYYNYTYRINIDTDITPPNLLNAQIPEQYNQFSQEFRVASDTDQRVTYLAGAYFQADHLQVNQDLSYFFLTPKVESLPPFAALVPYLPLAQETIFGQEEHDYSLFGSVSWSVTDRLKVSTGLRGTWVQKTYDWNLHYGTATEPFGGVVPIPEPVATLPAKLGLGTPGTLGGTRNDDAWMPSTKLQYQLNPAAMAYFSYTRGFKAGGFNAAYSAVTGVNAEQVPFSPEHVDAYELGLKSTWFDRRVLVNFDVFRENYSNLQVATNQNNGAGTYVSLVNNAADSVSEGAELDVQWVISQHFRLRADTTYDDSHYGTFPGVALTQFQTFCHTAANLGNPSCVQAFGGTGNPGPTQDLSGRPTSFSPLWSGSATAAYVTDLPGSYRLSGELTGIFSTGYFTNNGLDDPLTHQDSYTRLDALITLGTADGRWSLDVLGKNLTNRLIYASAYGLGQALGTIAIQKEEPRNFAAQVRFHW